MKNRLWVCAMVLAVGGFASYHVSNASVSHSLEQSTGYSVVAYDDPLPPMTVQQVVAVDVLPPPLKVQSFVAFDDNPDPMTVHLVVEFDDNPDPMNTPTKNA